MKRPYRLFSGTNNDWHLSYVASYGKEETAIASAKKKIQEKGIFSSTTSVMVVDADTGEVLFRIPEQSS